MRYFASITCALVLALASVTAHAETWVLDKDHTSIGFKVRHLMVSNVKGEFRSFSGEVEGSDRDLTLSRVSVIIDTASIDTGVKARDEHLRSPDFFDTARYPKMTFISKRVVKSGDGLKLIGDLTIRGITREVVLDVEGPTSVSKDPWGGIRRGASATGKINRKDFGLTWNKALETGGVAVGEEVVITLDVELIRK